MNNDPKPAAMTDEARLGRLLACDKATPNRWAMGTAPIPRAVELLLLALCAGRMTLDELEWLASMSPTAQFYDHLRTLRDDNAALTARLETAMEALKAIGGGSFPGASNFAATRDWQGFVDQLQSIARRVPGA